MLGRDLKAEATRSGVPLYQLAAAAGINNTRLSRLLNDHEPLDDRDRDRIRDAIERLTTSRLARR